MRDTLEVTVTWFWLNIPPAVLFFLAWTLIPLRMVFRHPDTVPGVPARDESPAQPHSGDHGRLRFRPVHASHPCLSA
jgi:hypothetical protein